MLAVVAGSRLGPRCFGGGYGGFQFGIARGGLRAFSVGDDLVEMGFERTDAVPVYAGAFKKKLGLTIVSDKPQGGERVYRIA